MYCLKTSRQKVSGMWHIIFSVVYPSPKIVAQISGFLKFQCNIRIVFLVKILINFNGLDTFDDNTEFFTEIKIIEFDTKTAKFNVAFNIGDQSNVFAIDIMMNFALEFSLKKNVRLNLCIASISNIKANISSGTITIKDETGLINAINESFDFKN